MTKVLAKLHKITVINVQTITTTLSLDTCTKTTSEEVAFQETDDKFTVFVGSAGKLGKSINLPICRALSRLLDIEMMTLHSCITHPVDVVKGLFEFNGAAGVPFHGLLEGEFAGGAEGRFFSLDLQQSLEFELAVDAQARGGTRVGGQYQTAEGKPVGGASGNVVAALHVIGLIAHRAIAADADAIAESDTALFRSVIGGSLR